jgi:hypothetical protein
MLMANIVWIAPALLFVIVIVVNRVRPVLALALFLVGPFIAMLMLFFGATLTAQLVGEIPVLHLRDLLALAFTFYIFDVWQVLYPHGAFLGILVLLIYLRVERFYQLQFFLAGRRLASGVLVGVAVGGLFAALVLLLVLLTQQNKEFVGFITGGTLERLDLSTELLTSVCTGAADGALVAILGVKVFRPKHLDGAVESVST